MKLRLPKEAKLRANDSRMGVNARVCTICGKNKQPRFWTCLGCAKEYKLRGKSYKAWPEWVKEMVRMRRREEYKSRILEEISFDPHVMTVIIDDSNYEKSRGGFFAIG